ncbi:cupin domain-containing protein [Amycolatopsis carbonis]|uniref:Cupin domain-containing protein n=1 Tax=Amycolatopsis carbonis TaxID=715471 RepID=A0A9Y2IAC2_9PSEU|nr:cupin domain-containing protein [Amycolatopsis sp. 2-15]WIX76037.1 cupin domain-containing protein [Amycolatopsis sp. 2-15]
MDHLLVDGVEKALGWSGPTQLGKAFARGQLPDPAVCDRLLTPHRLLDIAMRRSLSPPQFRCLQAGHELHPREYIATTRTRRGQAIPMVDMDRLGRLIESGATVVLDTTDTFDPTMEVACRALQWWAGELVQVNTYLTTKDAAGFDLHWDDHDVLVVQVAGEKSWEVRGTSRVAPMFRDAEPNTEPSDETVWAGTMTAGDVMHIPRGYWHQATRTDRTGEAGSGFSLHVTFGFVQRAGVDWVSWLADQAREQELFRHDLEHDDGPSGQAATLAGAVAELAGKLPPAEFLTARRRQQRPRRHLSTFATFGPPEQVVCVAEFPPEIVTADDGSVTVLAAGRRIRFAAKALPVVRRLCSGNPVPVADVAAETGIDAARIAEILLRENVCAEVGPDLSSGYTGLVTTG